MKAISHLLLAQLGPNFGTSVGVVGNDASAPLFSQLFFTIFHFPIFSLSQPFLVEGVIRSKNLFSEEGKTKKLELKYKTLFKLTKADQLRTKSC